MTWLKSYSGRLSIATALLSAALIAYQVAIMQLLSFVQWHHFANMIISIALLGFGAAGSLLSLYRKQLLQISDTLLPLLMIFSGAAMALAVELNNSRTFRFDSYLLFTDRRQWLALLMNYIFFFIPFFSGALALGIIFVKHVAAIGKFYFSNLAGSGIGAVLAAILAWFFMPANFTSAVALPAIAAGCFIISPQKKLLTLSVALCSTAFIVYKIIFPAELNLSQYKSLSRTMHLPAAQITLQKASPYGLLQVVQAEALRYAPGLSLAFSGEVPEGKAIFNNGDWYGPVTYWYERDSFHLLDYTSMSMPYVLKQRKKVLVLHAASGLFVSQALSNGADEIDAVEQHRVVAGLLKNELAGDNDSLYHRPQTKLYVTEPRTFLSAADKKYDLIQLAVAGSFGGGVGLFAMREEYSMTKEAFLKMWHLLADDGVISISAWMDYPFRNSLKTAATLIETLEAAGINQLPFHLAAVRSWGTVTFILKKSPITAADTSRVRAFCNEMSFDPLLLPGLQPHERMLFNRISDTSFFTCLDELMAGKKEKLYSDYDFHLRPATDDKPYFSQFLRWKSLPYLSGIFGSQSVSFLELGWLVAAITFLQITALAVLLIILPLFRLERGGKGKLRAFFYFSGLGIGYMFLEIVLIQKFILFLGNPVYAAAFVIAVLMLASGAGSYYSSRFDDAQADAPTYRLNLVLFVIAVLLLLYSWLLAPVLTQLTAVDAWLKLFISVFIIALPAFFMGMPFPLGLKRLAATEEKNVPWAWGINGCMSVISAAMASLLTVETGFASVLLFAACAYAISLLSLQFLKK